MEKETVKAQVHEGNGSSTDHSAMTLQEVQARWLLHQAVCHCTSTTVETLRTPDNKIIGFKCGCGFTFKNGEKTL